MEVISAKDIVVDKDGLPVDKVLRRIALNVIMRMRLSYPITKDEFRDRMYNVAKKIFKRPDCPILAAQQIQLAKALDKSGVIRIEQKDGYGVYYHPMPKFLPKKPETYEERVANFNASIRGIAERLVDGKEAQEKAFTLVRGLKLARRAHVGKAGRYDAVICPEHVELGRNGVKISKAIFAVILPNGCKFYRATGNAIKTDICSGEFEISINLKKSTPFPYFDFIFNNTIMMTYTSEGDFIHDHHRSLSTHVKKLLKGSLSGVNNQREQFGKLIGEEISEEKWRSAVVSIKNGFKSRTNFRWLISQAMDKEARRLAYRRANFMGRDYNWFLDTTPENRKRRRQASDAFPALLRILTLKNVTAAIDEGRPLIPVLTEVTGLPASKIKKLAGLTRAKFRMKNVNSIDSFACGPHPLREYAATIPVDYFDVDKDKFRNMLSIGQDWLRYGYPFAGDFTTKVAANPSSSEKVFLAVREPATSVACFIEELIVGYFDWIELPGGVPLRGKPCGAYIQRILFEEVVGSQFSKKRAVRFNELWHRHVNPVAVEQRAYCRHVRGLVPKVWPALQEDFVCEHGILKFLTSDDELHAEGQIMDHCVGGYYRECMTGGTHIAAIEAKDGSRSTIQLCISNEEPDEGRLWVVQHHSFHNSAPSEMCAAVEHAFFAKFAKKKYRIKQKKKVENEVYEGIEAVAIPDEKANEFLRLYDPIMPDALKGKDIAWWRERAKQEMDKNITFDFQTEFRGGEGIQDQEFYCDAGPRTPGH